MLGVAYHRLNGLSSRTLLGLEPSVPRSRAGLILLIVYVEVNRTTSASACQGASDTLLLLVAKYR